jgi:hypothetical protein
MKRTSTSIAIIICAASLLSGCAAIHKEELDGYKKQCQEKYGIKPDTAEMKRCIKQFDDIAEKRRQEFLEEDMLFGEQAGMESMRAGEQANMEAMRAAEQANMEAMRASQRAAGGM